MSPIEHREPAQLACNVLLRRLERETDARKREMLIRDCMFRATGLSKSEQNEVALRVADSFAAGGDSRASEPLPLSPSRATKKVDALVITVQPVEYRTSLAVFGLDPDDFIEHEDRRYHEGELLCERTGEQLQIVLTTIGEAGNVIASNAVNEMRRQYDADLYMLVGIAAGRWDAVKQGDLLIPSVVLYVEPGVSIPGGHLPEPKSVSLKRRIKMLSQYYDPGRTPFYPDLEAALATLAPDLLPPGISTAHRPTLVDKSAIATSEKLLRDGSLVELSGEAGINRTIKLGDMESYGFAEAAGAAEWVVFRSVSDYGDPDKNDGWQHFAAMTASVGARDFLRSTYRPPASAEL